MSGVQTNSLRFELGVYVFTHEHDVTKSQSLGGVLMF